MSLDDLDELLSGLEPEQEPLFADEPATVGAPSRGRRSARPRRPQAHSAAPSGGLRPWQRFILSFFLFLDVVIVGLMMLLMLERIVLP